MQNIKIDTVKQNLQQIIEQENAKLTEQLEGILKQNTHFSLLAEQLQKNLNQEIMKSQQLLELMARRYSEDVEVALQGFINTIEMEDEMQQALLLQRESHRLEQAIYQKSAELEVEITLLNQALTTLIRDIHTELQYAVETPNKFDKVKLAFQQKCMPSLKKNWRHGSVWLGTVLERFALKLKAA
ncbi:hypothetical protein ACT2CV_04200 [Pasteurellaceae bacterium 22721_9_1]